MSLSIFNSKSLKLSLLVAGGLFAFFGTGKLYLLQKIPPGLFPEQKSFWIDKVQADEDFDIVIIGDSRIYRGVSSKPFTSSPPIRVLNFGFSSGGLTDPLLKSGCSKLNPAGLRTIILGVSPNSLTPTAGRNYHYKLCKTAPKRYFKLSSFWQLFFSRKGSSLAIKQLRGKIDSNQGYFQVPHSDGWVESRMIPPDLESGINSYRELFAKEQVSAKIQERLFDRITQWSDSGINVFGFRPPTTKEMERLENECSGFLEADFVKKFNESGGTWIDISERFEYESYDGSHLTGDSAIKLSSFLAERVSQTNQSNSQ